MLSKEQEQYRQLAQDFAINKIVPKATQHDPSDHFLSEILDQAWNLGLMTACMPEPYGGFGLGTLDGAVIIEELAHGCGGIATVILASMASQLPLILMATEVQKGRFLKPLAEKPLIAGYEQTSFSSPRLFPSKRGTNVHLKAKRTPTGYILNGKTPYMINADTATWYYTTACVANEQGLSHYNSALSSFVIPRNSKGVLVGKKSATLGLKALHVCEIDFDDVAVDKDSLLGEEGQSSAIAASVIERLYPLISAICVGIAKAAMECAIRYAKERKTFGQPISQHQAIAFMLADMAKDIEAARLLCRQASTRADNNLPNYRDALIAKVFAQEMAMRAVTDAVQVLGGYGYSREYPVEKLMRDTMALCLFEETNPKLRFSLGGHLIER